MIGFSLQDAYIFSLRTLTDMYSPVRHARVRGVSASGGKFFIHYGSRIDIARKEFKAVRDKQCELFLSFSHTRLAWRFMPGFTYNKMYLPAIQYNMLCKYVRVVPGFKHPTMVVFDILETR
jgi:hypothetical protein